jgi:ATP adenylyltransferase
MKRIWAPWRMKFVETYPFEPGCVFCNVQRQGTDAENLTVFHGQKAFVILNRYPYTSGHILVVANDHLPTLEALEAQTRAEMMELANRSMQVLRRVYQPEGFNFGSNIGAVAGAGIPGHIHLHVVPRWAGDTSFMSTVGTTRVLPEGLDETYRRVCAAWNEST